MSTFIVDNLKGKTTTTTMTVFAGHDTDSTTTTNLEKGLAKVFVIGASNKASVLTSFNCSHLSDDGSGKQSVTLTNPFSDSNYVPTTSINAGGDKAHTHSRTSSSVCQFISRDASGGGLEDLEVSATIHGDLA